ncbi:MAG: sulfatase/phosphatase domain-containing protein [bacterium]
MRWPQKLPSGYISDVCLNTPDIMPTLLSLMNLPIPEEVEGMNLAHCILGEEGPEPEAAFMMGTGAVADWEDGHEWRALRNKRYTYAVYRVDGKEFLFDNVEDPYQMRNLVEDLRYRDILDYFRDLLKKRMEELGDTFEASTWYRDNWTKDRIILIPK